MIHENDRLMMNDVVTTTTMTMGNQVKESDDDDKDSWLFLLFLLENDVASIYRQ